MNDKNQIMTVAAFTHEGSARSENQDSILINDRGVFLVADGMGGHDAGSQASRAVVDCVVEVFSELQDASGLHVLGDAIQRANQMILGWSQQQRSGGISGTTVVLLWVTGHHYHIYWVGDSRCYLYRNHVCRALTWDDRLQGSHNVLTKAVGVSSGLTLSYQTGWCDERDWFLLCSDGISELFSDQELGQYCQYAFSNVEESASLLKREALRRTAKDNISAIFVQPSSQPCARAETLWPWQPHPSVCEQTADTSF